MRDSSIQNQSYLRNINQKTILKYLRKEKLSCADLAKKMKLSNTAIAKITEELVQKKILIKHDSQNQDVGRRPIHLHINPEAGVVFVINLAGRQITLLIADMSEKILCQKKVPVTGKITKKLLGSIIIELKNMYEKCCGSLKLLSVCIAAPGKIDLNTGYFLLAHHFTDYKEINLKKIFSDEFDCDILIHNDIKLALEGERIYGTALAAVKNAMMLHIGYSVGSALMLNENIYNGSHGFAGELTNFSLNTLTDNDDIFFPQNKNNLDSLSLDGILNIIKRAIANGQQTILKSLADKPENITLENVLTAYETDDEYVKNIINQSAMIWARTIRNMAEFLDMEVVILSGDIVKFGDEFKNTIENYVNRCLEFQDIRVIYSELANEGVISGGINSAINKALSTLLKNI